MSQAKALVIDDEPDICELLTMTLGRMNILAESAADVASAKRLLGAEDFDLCLTDNGFDVDILVRCSLRTMIAVWTCRRRFDEAVVSRDISVKGAPRLSASLQAWLGASALSRLGAQGPQPVA